MGKPFTSPVSEVGKKLADAKSTKKCAMEDIKLTGLKTMDWKSSPPWILLSNTALPPGYLLMKMV